MTLALVNNTAVPQQNKSLLKSFISNFASESFFTDIISLALYPADFGSSNTIVKSETIIDSIKFYLKDLTQTCYKIGFPNYQQIKMQAEVVTSILVIRESTPAIVSYDNVHQFINLSNLAAKKIINNAINNKITSLSQFKDSLNNIIAIISSYKEIKEILNNLLMFDILVSDIDSNKNSVFESIRSYRDLIINSYNDLSKLNSINNIDNQMDYFILGDKNTQNDMSNYLVDYITNHYSFFKTGYDLFDKNIEGFESSSVHIIAAPTNHGKSLFLMNLARTLIQNNIDDFTENDIVLFMTLEDNLAKATRRINSIFGNINSNIIRDSYKYTSKKIKALTKENSDIKPIQEKLKHLLNDINVVSNLNVTQDKVKVGIKYCPENSFSPGDLSKFIDQIKVTHKLNTKIIFLDYIDCMKPTLNGVGKSISSDNEYYTQGIIMQELRSISRQYNIPIITATQNTRQSENLNVEMTNMLVGDSIKKVRYTDFLYQTRMCTNKTFLDAEVAACVVPRINNQQQDPLLYESLKDVLIPYEVKITKSKDSGKDKKTFMLFCKENLRIYNNIEEYVADNKQLKQNTKDLEAALNDILIDTYSPNISFFNDDDF